MGGAAPTSAPATATHVDRVRRRAFLARNTVGGGRGRTGTARGRARRDPPTPSRVTRHRHRTATNTRHAGGWGRAASSHQQSLHPRWTICHRPSRSVRPAPWPAASRRARSAHPTAASPAQTGSAAVAQPRRPRRCSPRPERGSPDKCCQVRVHRLRQTVAVIVAPQHVEGRPRVFGLVEAGKEPVLSVAEGFGWWRCPSSPSTRSGERVPRISRVRCRRPAPAHRHGAGARVVGGGADGDDAVATGRRR